MPAPDPSSAFELAKAFAPLLGAVFGFFGVVFGSMIGMPFLERYRDKISSDRVWENQRKELVERIRLVSAYIDTFLDLKTAIDNPTKLSGDRSKEIYLKAIKKFDFESLDKAIQQLSVLPPGASDSSGSAQYLVQQLLTVSLLVRIIQDETSEMLFSDAFVELNERLARLRLFIASDHAKILGLKGLTLANNAEKVLFDWKLMQIRNQEALETLKDLGEKTKFMFPNEERAVDAAKDQSAEQAGRSTPPN